MRFRTLKASIQAKKIGWSLLEEGSSGLCMSLSRIIPSILLIFSVNYKSNLKHVKLV